MSRSETTVLVLGPWGSGTTAVAGVVSCLGIPPAGPFYATGDDRTPIPLESQTLCKLVDAAMDYKNLRKTGSLDWQTWRATQPPKVCVKLPALAFFLEDIDYTHAIVVERSLEDIEATRTRREWPEHTGKRGAEAIYPLISGYKVKYDDIDADGIAEYLGVPKANPAMIRNWLQRQ